MLTLWGQIEFQCSIKRLFVVVVVVLPKFVLIFEGKFTIQKVFKTNKNDCECKEND